MPVVSWLILALTLLGLFLLAVDAGYFRKGRHRGEYVERPWWRGPWWRGPIIYIDQVGGVVFTGEDGRVGRFGDLDIDQADAEPLCPFLPDGSLDREGLQKQGWVELGAIEE